MLTCEKSLDIHREDVYCEYYNAMPWHREPAANATMVRDDRYKLAVAHGTGGGETVRSGRRPAGNTQPLGSIGLQGC